jgi:hypothetical protein
LVINLFIILRLRLNFKNRAKSLEVNFLIYLGVPLTFPPANSRTFGSGFPLQLLAFLPHTVRALRETPLHSCHRTLRGFHCNP